MKSASFFRLACLLLFSVVCRPRVSALRVEQPDYSGIQYADLQGSLPQQTSSQPAYISVPQQPQQFQTQGGGYRAPAAPSFEPPTQIVSQLLLPTNVDRQVCPQSGVSRRNTRSCRDSRLKKSSFLVIFQNDVTHRTLHVHSFESIQWKTQL